MFLDPTPLHQLNPTDRFSSRVTDYAQYRPSYPAAVIDAILSDGDAQTVADIGAGTGIAAQLLADRGLAVWAVEPNADMRAAIAPHPRITAWDGTAEATALADRTMDLVTAFQAFHWFQHDLALPELRRILKPDGRLAVVWNNRDRTDPFTKQYGQVLQSVTRKPVGIDRMGDATPLLEDSVYFTDVQHVAIPHRQTLDLAGLIGLAQSRSYTPQSGVAYEQLIDRLTHLFNEFCREGQVAIVYTANVYLARGR
jgi:SAM-dependent methyltransferase